MDARRDAHRREGSRSIGSQLCRYLAGGSRELPLNLTHPCRSEFALPNLENLLRRWVSDEPGAASGSRPLPSDRADHMTKRLPSRRRAINRRRGEGSPPDRSAADVARLEATNLISRRPIRVAGVNGHEPTQIPHFSRGSTTAQSAGGSLGKARRADAIRYRPTTSRIGFDGASSP